MIANETTPYQSPNDVIRLKVTVQPSTMSKNHTIYSAIKCPGMTKCIPAQAHPD